MALVICSRVEGGVAWGLCCHDFVGGHVLGSGPSHGARPHSCKREWMDSRQRLGSAVARPQVGRVRAGCLEVVAPLRILARHGLASA